MHGMLEIRQILSHAKLESKQEMKYFVTSRLRWPLLCASPSPVSWPALVSFICLLYVTPILLLLEISSPGKVIVALYDGAGSFCIR